MSDSTPRLGLPDLPDTPELYADTVADAFARLDAFTDLYLKSQYVNTPPASPSDGDAYLTGASPTGAWSGYPYKIAACRDGTWQMLTPFNGLRAFVAATNGFIVYANGSWLDWNSLISGAETSIASAATCDMGAAGSLFVQVTGTTAVTSFGTAANTLRFLRFAGVLTLTHNAASLILPGGASIVTAAGDCALFASDGSGNWRCRGYNRASGQPVAAALALASVHTSGAIGAGTSAGSGGSVLAAAGAIRSEGTTGSASPLLQLVSSGHWTWGIKGDGDTLTFQYDSNIGFQYMAGGGLTVGSGSPGWNSASTRVEGKGSIALSGWCVNGGDIAVQARADNAGGYAFAAYYTTSLVGTISYTGGGTGVAYNTTSDARLKAVCGEQADYRAAIQALWVGDFTWKDNGAPGFGVLAQQAHAVMPHHQGVTKPAAEDGIWHASAEPFGHLALWGVKDLYAMIAVLAARVAALEAAHDVV